MDTLTIRAYNVRFGDAFLIKIPDLDSKKQFEYKYILIDFGNAVSKEGGKDDVFKPVIKDILNELGEKGLDLYIMTHEHMDHVQGLLKSSKYENDLGKKLNIKYSWFTASSAPDYYQKFKEAKHAFDSHSLAYNEIASLVEVLGFNHFSDNFNTMLFVNNPRKTADCVDFLRGLTKSVNTFYIHRGFRLRKGKHHNFNTVKFNLLAPEEDSSIYYGRLKSMAFSSLDRNGKMTSNKFFENIPPPGVDAQSFFNMLEKRMNIRENLLAIDKARNNTSIVFMLEWGGWRFLFSGDAEEKSWKIIDSKNKLKEVDFLKVSHHASHNGTPDPVILDSFFPKIEKARRKNKKTALVTTFENQYNGIPHQPTLSMLQKRCDELSVLYREIPPGAYKDFQFKKMK